MIIIKSLFSKIESILSNQEINRYRVSVILVLISEIIFYFQFLSKVAIFNSSSQFQVFCLLLYIVALFSLKMNPSITFYITLFFCFIPFIFFPLVTFIAFLFIYIMFSFAEKKDNADYNFITSIICMTFIIINNSMSMIGCLLIPISLLFVSFGKQRNFSLSYFLTLALLIILFVIYPTKDNTLVSKINNAPLYTVVQKKEKIEGFESLQIYYTQEKLADHYTYDPLVLTGSDHRINIDNVSKIIYIVILGVSFSRIIVNFYKENNSILKLTILISTFSLGIVIFIENILNQEVLSPDNYGMIFTKYSILLLIAILFDYVMLYINSKEISLENNEPFKEKTMNDVLEYKEYLRLAPIGMALYSILTELCQEMVYCVSYEMYGDEWFKNVKEILDQHPSVFANPTAIVDYKKIDVTVATRLLNDRNYPIGQYTQKNMPRSLKDSINAARDARNDYNHNGYQSKLGKQQLYLLSTISEKLRTEIYKRFPKSFSSSLSEDYYKKIEYYTKMIDDEKEDN